MTVQVVNLRTKRKQMARAKAREAALSRPSVTKAERERVAAESDRARKHLDAHRRDDDG